MTSLNDLRHELLKDPTTAAEYAKLDLPYQIAREVIRLRQEMGLTQTDLAKQLNTQQSSISRLENMGSIPSLSFLTRVADALGAKVEIRLLSKQS